MLLACAAPAVDETLKSDDVSEILDELVEAQNHSYRLGLKLLPTYKVEAIHRQYQDPEDRLLHIFLAFTKQIQPRPTWRVIVEALRSPSVNLPTLAARVEAAHFHETHDVVPKPTTGMLPLIVLFLVGLAGNVSIISNTTESAVNTTADDDDVKSKPSPQLNPATGKSNHTTLRCSYLCNSSNSYGSGD